MNVCGYDIELGSLYTDTWHGLLLVTDITEHDVFYSYVLNERMSHHSRERERFVFWFHPDCVNPMRRIA